MRTVIIADVASQISNEGVVWSLQRGTFDNHSMQYRCCKKLVVAVHEPAF